MNSAAAKIAVDAESADLIGPERAARSPSALISNPIKLQQHIRGGDQSYCKKRRAPSKRRDDTTCQYGSYGPADAVSYGNEASAETAPMR